VEDLLRAELVRLRRLVAPSWVAEPPEVPGEIELDEVIEQVVEARRLAGQSIEWRPSGLRVLARRDELVQVLNILLVNAARHAVGSTASVEVVHDGVATRVSVTDDGPGVPDDVRPLIFERGIRGGDSQGQGLGLAIACSLARDLGGSLTLSDRRDHGASFELLLPHAALGGAA
jgi:signal transduction histidine kinase